LLAKAIMCRLALTACLVGLTGCVGDIVEFTPKGDASQNVDLGRGSDGGNPQAVHFNPEIMADIGMLSCAASTCHGGGLQILVLKPGSDAATIMQNYTSFTAQANMGANSPVLIRNLMTDPTTHSGGKPFASTSDPIYARWLAWIQAGNPQ
jgi:hypothetical protein